MRTRADFGWRRPVAAMVVVMLAGGHALATMCDPAGAVSVIDEALPLIDQCIAQLDAALLHVTEGDGDIGQAEIQLALADGPLDLAEALTASAAAQLALAGDELGLAGGLTADAELQINDALLHFTTAGDLSLLCSPCSDPAQEDMSRINDNLQAAAQQSADALLQYATAKAQRAAAQSQMEAANQQIFNAKQRRISAAAQLASAKQQDQDAQAQLDFARAQRDAARSESNMASGQMSIFPIDFARVFQKLQEAAGLHNSAQVETERANTKMGDADQLRDRALGHLQDAKADLERAMTKLAGAESDLLGSITETDRARLKKMRIAGKAADVLGQTLTVQNILADCGPCATDALAEIAVGALLTQTALDTTLAGLEHDDLALAALAGAQDDGAAGAVEAGAAIPPFDAAIGSLDDAGLELSLAIGAATESLGTGLEAAALNDQAISLIIDCPICTWDCASPADGAVSVVDLLALLAQWGQSGTSCDFDGTGVGVVALLKLLGHWGACP